MMLQLLVQTLTLMTPLAVVMATIRVSLDEVDAVSCLTARRHCRDDVACRQRLDSLHDVCGDNIYTCPAWKRRDCRVHLAVLQTSGHFVSCVCDPTHVDASQCLDVQKTIFLHACVLQEGSHANVSWLTAGYAASIIGSYSESETTRGGGVEALDGGGDEYVDGDDEDDQHGGGSDMSCIGVRKRCLVDGRCARLLADYRHYCRENKKQNECVAIETEKCLDAATSLRELLPELFNCSCAMKRPDTKERCNRIQWRLANNTCLVTVPYIVETADGDSDLSYDELLQLTSVPGQSTTADDASTCVTAFIGCHDDDACRRRLRAMLTDCRALLLHSCNRSVCLPAVRSLYLTDSPETAEALRFCRCGAGDARCDAIRRSLQPTCSRLQLPPPSCLDLVERCIRHPDCSRRLENLKDLCGIDDGNDNADFAVKCPSTSSPKLCRSAVLGLMGSILTTNCTCVQRDTVQQRRCLDVRRKLNEPNSCIAAGADEVNARLAQPTSSVSSSSRYQPGYSSDGAVQVVERLERMDCLRHFGQKIPSFMATPSVIRVYKNESGCSEVCRCVSGNRTAICRALPCAPHVSCKLRDVIYVHGSSFTLAARGHCRCINGELICAKPPSSPPPQRAGLFLHVGYSVKDQHVIEANTAVVFRADSIADKLGTLLNEDSAEQFCSVAVQHTAQQGNIIFTINVSKYNTRFITGDVPENCIRPAKTVSYMINSRHVAIISDVELSVLKVSLLERVQFHKPPVVRAPASTIAGAASRERKGASPAAAATDGAPRPAPCITVTLGILSTFQLTRLLV